MNWMTATRLRNRLWEGEARAEPRMFLCVHRKSRLATRRALPIVEDTAMSQTP
jgi:hypothetical protein